VAPVARHYVLPITKKKAKINSLFLYFFFSFHPVFSPALFFNLFSVNIEDHERLKEQSWKRKEMKCKVMCKGETRKKQDKMPSITHIMSYSIHLPIFNHYFPILSFFAHPDKLQSPPPQPDTPTHPCPPLPNTVPPTPRPIHHALSTPATTLSITHTFSPPLQLMPPTRTLFLGPCPK
jgi:hypothetical protein